MWRLFPFLKWICTSALIFEMVLAVVVDCQFLNPDQRCNAVGVLRTGGWYLVLGVVVLLSITVATRRSHRSHEAEAQFSLVKATEKLRPEDLSFQGVEQGAPLGSTRRPFHSTYIQRTAVPHQRLGDKQPRPVYSDADLVAELQRGRSLLLIGQPLEGKSRTLYELLKRLKGHIVVRPIPDRPVPPDDVFTPFKGNHVVLLLDDLTDFLGKSVDLKLFVERLEQHSASTVITATCRDGPELAAVRQSLDASVRYAYQKMRLLLSLLPPTQEQKAALVRSLGHQWHAEMAEDFPTLGSIVMEEPLRAMQDRFGALARECRDVLRALKLLASAGVLPFTHARVVATVAYVFRRDATRLGDWLDDLAAAAFLARPARQDPIDPEPAYLLGAVQYIEGRVPEDDFTALRDMLFELRDIPGLLYLGETWWLLEDDQHSLATLNRVIELAPELSLAWSNRGIVLDRAGDPEAALADFEEAIRLDPDYGDAWYHKGMALARLGEYERAVEAYVRAIDLERQRGLDWSEAWENKAYAEFHLGWYDNAVDSCDVALSLREDYPTVLNIKGVALSEMQPPRLYDALACFDRARKLSPEYVDAWFHLGVAYGRLDRHSEAVDAYDQALRLRPDYPQAWANKGLALIELEEEDEAFLWLCRAWKARDRLRTGFVRLIEANLERIGHHPESCHQLSMESLLDSESTTETTNDTTTCKHVELVRSIRPRLEERGAGASTIQRCEECGWLVEMVYSQRRGITFTNFSDASNYLEVIVDASQVQRIHVVPPKICMTFAPGTGLRQEVEGEIACTPETGVPSESYMSSDGVRQVSEWITEAYFDGVDGWTRDEVKVEVRPAGAHTWTVVTDDGQEFTVAE